jgi:uncharacterized protein (TIGR00645 family)
LIDLALVSSLIVMVMLSGYENFVSRIEVATEESEKLGWLGKLDAGTLKLKVAASIVAISSIHLLKVFMDAATVPKTDKIMWYVCLHRTFVISAVLLAVLDRLAFAIIAPSIDSSASAAVELDQRVTQAARRDFRLHHQ